MSTIHAIINNKQAFKVATGAVYVIVDQVIYAATNFIINIILARTFLPSEYGAYTLVFSTFWLVSTVHSAFISEPMMVFASSSQKNNQRSYIHKLLNLHWALSFFLLTIGGSAGYAFWLLNQKLISVSLWGITIAAPFMLLLWLIRRLSILQGKAYIAAITSSLYFVVTIGLVFLLKKINLFNIGSVFLLLTISSGLVALMVWGLVTKSLSSTNIAIEYSHVIKDHFAYGRWIFGGGILSWVPHNFYYFLLPLFANLEATAALKALTNLVQPVMQVIGALGVFLIPIFVHKRDSKNINRIVILILLIFTSASLLYWGFLGLLNKQLVNWVYSGSYLDYSEMLWILGLIPIATGITTVVGSVLRALEKPKLVFRSYMISLIVTIFIGGSLVYLLNILGASLGIVISMSVVSAMLVIYYLRISRNDQNK